MNITNGEHLLTRQCARLLPLSFRHNVRSISNGADSSLIRYQILGQSRNFLIVLNLKMHYCAPNSRTFSSILPPSLNPVHILPSCSKIYFNIIFSFYTKKNNFQLRSVVPSLSEALQQWVG